jgi:hypothetical protein
VEIETLEKPLPLEHFGLGRRYGGKVDEGIFKRGNIKRLDN